MSTSRTTRTSAHSRSSNIRGERSQPLPPAPRGDDPVVNGVGSLGTLHLDDALGLPVPHVVVVRDDPGAGLQVPQQLGAEPEVHRGQEIQGDHGGLPDVGVEDVALDEAHAVGHASLPRVLVSLPDPPGIDVDARAPGAKSLGGGDDDPAIPGPEVVQHVALADAGDREHGCHHLVRGGDIGNFRTHPAGQPAPGPTAQAGARAAIRARAIRIDRRARMSSNSSGRPGGRPAS